MHQGTATRLLHARAAPVQQALRQPPFCARPTSSVPRHQRVTPRGTRYRTGATRPCRHRPTVERLSQIPPQAAGSNCTARQRGCRAATASGATAVEASPRQASRHRGCTARPSLPTPPEVAPRRASSRYDPFRTYSMLCCAVAGRHGVPLLGKPPPCPPTRCLMSTSTARGALGRHPRDAPSDRVATNGAVVTVSAGRVHHDEHPIGSSSRHQCRSCNLSCLTPVSAACLHP